MLRFFAFDVLQLSWELTVPGDKGIVEKRATELEQRLRDLERQFVDQQSRAKEDLNDARNSAALREQEYAAQVSELARMMEG